MFNRDELRVLHNFVHVVKEGNMGKVKLLLGAAEGLVDREYHSDPPIKTEGEIRQEICKLRSVPGADFSEHIIMLEWVLGESELE